MWNETSKLLWPEEDSPKSKSSIFRLDDHFPGQVMQPDNHESFIPDWRWVEQSGCFAHKGVFLFSFSFSFLLRQCLTI